MHHRMMLGVVVEAAVTGMPSEAVAGEENDRDDEHDPGDDGNPGGELEDPGCPVWRWL